MIYPGQEESAFGDLVQTAWMQIERTLYKFRSKPHCRACYNPDRPMDSALYVPDEGEYGIITFPELFGKEKNPLRIGDLRVKRQKCPYKGHDLLDGPTVGPSQGLFGGSESVLYRGNSKVFNMWCCSPDTQLITSSGIMSIDRAIVSGVDTTYGMCGQKSIVATVQKPEQNTLKITTELGYQIECSPEHGLYCLGLQQPDWILTDNIKEGDLLGIQYNTNYYVGNDDISNIELESRGDWQPPRALTSELAYLIGLYISEGSWSHGKFLIYNTSNEVIDKLVHNDLGLNFINEPKYDRISLCNVRFIEFMEKLGFKHIKRSQDKYVSQRMLQASELIIRSMLSGMFDGDGHSTRHNGTVGYTSTSKLLIDQVRMLLLNAGMLSKIQHDDREESIFEGEIREHDPDGSWQLMLSTRDSKIFYDTIGFKINYKNIKVLALKTSRERIYGLHSKITSLYAKYGVGNLSYDVIRTLLIDRGFYIIDTILNKLRTWDSHNDDPDYKYIVDRLDERSRTSDNIVWLPVRKIEHSNSRLCEISVDSSDHSYIANGIISHNSQVARTVILAFVKKECRDKKNANSYRDHLANKVKIDEDRLGRFFTEIQEISKFNDDYSKCLEALRKVVTTDDKPHDGLIGKLVKESELSRAQVTGFIRMLRLRSHEFTDSPLSKEANRAHRHDHTQPDRSYPHSEDDPD